MRGWFSSGMNCGQSPCDRLKVEPLDRPDDELDTSLDILSRLATAAESVETIRECFDLYPELQPPADAVTL
jgi:hypothetical protein